MALQMLDYMRQEVKTARDEARAAKDALDRTRTDAKVTPEMNRLN